MNCPLQVGEYAWSPNKAITNDYYDIWHYYDIPLKGAFKLDLQWWVFDNDDAFWGEENPVARYFPVSSTEYVNMPETFDSGEQFDEWFVDMVEDKPLWIAQLDPDNKILSWEEDYNHA